MAERSHEVKGVKKTGKERETTSDLIHLQLKLQYSFVSSPAFLLKTYQRQPVEFFNHLLSLNHYQLLPLKFLGEELGWEPTKHSNNNLQ
jgi:hypothetical protein